MNLKRHATIGTVAGLLAMAPAIGVVAPASANDAGDMEDTITEVAPPGTNCSIVTALGGADPALWDVWAECVSLPPGVNARVEIDLGYDGPWSITGANHSQRKQSSWYSHSPVQPGWFTLQYRVDPQIATTEGCTAEMTETARDWNYDLHGVRAMCFNLPHAVEARGRIDFSLQPDETTPWLSHSTQSQWLYSIQKARTSLPMPSVALEYRLANP